jgi:hypothetical protein
VYDAARTAPAREAGEHTNDGDETPREARHDSP